MSWVQVPDGSPNTVVLWEVYLLVVIKSPYATVNGSNSAGKLTIEVPHDESVSIGCSAYYIVLVLDGFEGGPYKALHEVQLFGGLPTQCTRCRWIR